MAGADTESKGLPLRRTELLLIFAFWTVLALLIAASRVLDPRGPGSVQSAIPTTPIILAFTESYLWAVLTVPLFWLTSRFSLDDPRDRVEHVLLFLGLGLVAAMFVDVLLHFVRMELFPFRLGGRRGGPPPTWLTGLTRLWFLDDLIYAFAIISAGIARDIFARYRARQDEAVRLTAHAAQLQAQLAEARLTVLRTQLNPHFLFNTLHAVSSLVERDPRGVRRMISRLSELLRRTLEGTNEQEISLEREIELLRLYLDIMQVRFQGRLLVHIDIDDELLPALVPNLILQPLVENAIKHGVSRVEESGRVEVSARRSEEELVLTVRDNGPGVADGRVDAAGNGARDDSASGVGLRNTRARLEELYGEEQRLTLRPADDGGTIAEVRLPYHTRADLRTVEVSSAAAFSPSG